MTRRCARVLVCGALLWLASPARAQQPIQLSGGAGHPISVVVRDAPLAEVFEMLSRKERINVVLGDGVEGNVSVSLFDVTLDQAIRTIAEAAGYVAERRLASYLIIERDQAGKDSANGNAVLRAFKVQYSEPEKVAEIVAKHLSRYGESTVFADRRLIVVEDLPDFVHRIDRLLAEIDREPEQILIEAKILEITLDENETYGVDWVQFLGDGETGDIGVQGLSTLGSPGFFLDYVKLDNLQVALSALSDEGRVRTLSTPTLLAVEHENAEVVIGDRLGFRVTTTINEVTNESVEFLESGVILKFRASVDRRGRVLLEVHPEVSTGNINDGLPDQTTAEVTTTLLAEDGQTIFIGGLIKDRLTEGHSGAPFLNKIPILGYLFSRYEDVAVRTETVVVVTAHVVDEGRRRLSREKTRELEPNVQELEERARDMKRNFDRTPEQPAPTPAGEGAPAGG